MSALFSGDRCHPPSKARVRRQSARVAPSAQAAKVPRRLPQSSNKLLTTSLHAFLQELEEFRVAQRRRQAMLIPRLPGRK